MFSHHKKIQHFKGLNSLRFFAALLVLMQHTETIRKKNGLENLEWLGLFRNGVNAVTFFFVLSGFLITYLLLKENDKTHTVNIGRFYIKRMLRIWPLYFLIFFIGTLLLPQVLQLLNIQYQMPYQFGQVWYYFVFFLPGLVTFYFGHHLLEPLWSIGVEEVFYLIWAPIFKFFKKRLLIILSAIIVLKTATTLMSIYVFHSALLTFILDIFKFDAMAIGAIGAYVIFNLKQSVSTLVIYKKGAQAIIYCLLSVYLVFHDNIKNQYWDMLFKTPIFSELLIDSMFIYLIIGVSLVDQSVIKLENRFLSFLGEISYGIYMYHMLIIFAIMQFGKLYFAELNLFSGTLLFYILLLGLVILMASISKKYFENIFLNIKRRVEARRE